MSVRQNGIAEIVLIRAPDIPAPTYTHRMFRPGASLCMKDIVVLSDPVQMRSFRPMYPPHGAVPYVFGLPLQFPGIQIQFLDPDIPVSIVSAALRIGMGADIITSAVCVKEQAGINTSCPFQIMRLGPGAFRVFGCDHIIASMGHIGTDHIKGTRMVADRGGK